MPLYEYKCTKCGHRFEKIVKFSDPPIKKCPKCKGVLEQLISSSAIQFKGTGWYVTDYAGKSAPAEESAKKSEETKETKSSEQKADEKSDQKSKDKKKESSTKESPAKESAPKGAKESKKSPA